MKWIADRLLLIGTAIVCFAVAWAIIAGTGDPYNGLALGGTEFPDAAKQRIAQTNDPAVKALVELVRAPAEGEFPRGAPADG